MYGKLFESMYTGTIKSDWKAMVTFQQFVILADENGIVDMMPSHLSDTTGLPLGLIKHGIAVLESPDPNSRTPDEEGRRIILMDEHRPWGWFIVNYKMYRDLSSRKQRSEQSTERSKRYRERHKNLNENSDATLGNARQRMQRHTDADTDVDKNIKKEEECSEVSIPLKSGGTFTPTSADIERWTLAFSTLDVPATLLVIASWNEANPKGRKTLAGICKHINGWLSRDADKAGPEDKEASKPGGGRKPL